MRTIPTALAFLLMAVSFTAAAGPPAGMVLYADGPDGVWLLLADHAAPSARGWGGFGGHHEAGETPLETAARETEEETRGFFKRGELARLAGGREAFFDGRFALFFVRVDRVPVEVIEKQKPPPDAVAFRERGPFAWVPFAEVEPLLTAGSTGGEERARIAARYLPAERNTDWFWPVWIGNLRAAREANAIPWLAEK